MFEHHLIECSMYSACALRHQRLRRSGGASPVHSLPQQCVLYIDPPPARLKSPPRIKGENLPNTNSHPRYPHVFAQMQEKLQEKGNKRFRWYFCSGLWGACHRSESQPHHMHVCCWPGWIFIYISTSGACLKEAVVTLWQCVAGSKWLVIFQP